MSSADQSPVALLKGMRRIYRFCRQRAGYLVVGTLMVVLASSVNLVMPLGLRELIDAVFKSNNRTLLNTIALGLLGLFVVQAVVSSSGRYLLKRTGERVVADLRKRLYAHLQDLDLTYFTNERIGDITSRLTNDVSSIREAIARGTVSLLADSLKLLGSVSLMVVLNWRLSILTFAVMPAAALLSRYLGKRIRQLARQVQDLLADTTAIAEQALSAIRVVKAFARAPYEKQRYGQAVDHLFETARHKAWVTVIFSSLITLVFSASLVAIFWFGGNEVLAGRLSAGDLIAFIFYASNVSESTRALSRLYATFNNAAGATSRLFELLDTEPAIQNAPHAIALPSVQGRVRFEHVEFAYEPEVPVLRGIDFEVEPGETIALVGPSGAGKTTLLHLIPRFFDPTGGQITLDGHALHAVRVQSLRRHIALVSQDIHLFGDTVQKNIQYGHLEATDAEIKRAARAANAEEFILDLPEGYETPVGERGLKLSGGQRQRIAIARALLKEAPILLLDEATSSLDSPSEAQVQEALERLTASCTTFVIAHRLATVRDADRIFVLDDGRIVEEGTHVELYARQGLYREMASHQFHDAPAVA